ncbi:MAG: 2Fe-2S iron-sulfur cluster-binding protein, partial [Anaerolineae bacterium]
MLPSWMRRSRGSTYWLPMCFWPRTNGLCVTSRPSARGKHRFRSGMVERGSRTCYIDFEPVGRRAACRPDTDLLTIAREAGISIAAVCGGRGTCGRCRVKVLE